MGPCRGSGGPRCLLVAYRAGPARLCRQWLMRPRLVGVLLEGIPKPMGICSLVPGLCLDALVSSSSTETSQPFPPHYIRKDELKKNINIK